LRKSPGDSVDGPFRLSVEEDVKELQWEENDRKARLKNIGRRPNATSLPKKQPVGHAFERIAANRLSSVFLDPEPARRPA
jgi:hypothetical protein